MTSMISCNRAPATGDRRPPAANPMAAIDRPMPRNTLCNAIDRDRRAMRIASTSRSSRSTTSTTSAASEEAVAPRAPMATPTSAAANAGASLIPSPTITVTAAVELPARLPTSPRETFPPGPD